MKLVLSLVILCVCMLRKRHMRTNEIQQQMRIPNDVDMVRTHKNIYIYEHIIMCEKIWVKSTVLIYRSLVLMLHGAEGILTKLLTSQRRKKNNLLQHHILSIVNAIALTLFKYLVNLNTFYICSLLIGMSVCVCTLTCMLIMYCIT